MKNGFELVNTTSLVAGGEYGYNTFRIPALIKTSTDAVLAFCEARKDSPSDTGNIDLVVWRSDDGGNTWKWQGVVVGDGENTWGNPCLSIDRHSARIILLVTHNLANDTEMEIWEGRGTSSRTIWQLFSDDDGHTWSRPKQITSQIKEENWTWYATGPGTGIQTSEYRMMMPCDHVVDMKTYSHIIYSDDGGNKWRVGGILPPGTNECQIVELSTGAVMMNSRNYLHRGCRAVAISNDGTGEKWDSFYDDIALIEPTCHAALISVGETGLLAFSNPASRKRRENMTLRTSLSNGEKWENSLVLYAGPSAYSSLCWTGKNLLCLYEAGERSPYERISLATLKYAQRQGWTIL